MKEREDKMGIMSLDAKELILEKINEFNMSDEDMNNREKMRNEFILEFTPEKIKRITAKEYFPGLGKKEGCIGYQLEWGTSPLGSIKGGSMAKYGSKEQFAEIKKLLIDLTSCTDKKTDFYKNNGELTNLSKKLISKSIEIRGMKSGCTVLGKLLSIYYPDTFIPFFTDQGYLLESLLTEYSQDSIGLESFFKNNYLFIEIKEEIISEPAFAKLITSEKIANDFLYKFIYFCFPRTKGAKEQKVKEEQFEALETQHYQNLIHRNFKKLFGSFSYVDEETQNSHDGHYSTEDVGTMDFLCLDDNNDFVVIELKRKGTDKTLAQLCRYMGWVKENLAKKNQKVHGLIVSESKDIKLEYAIKVVPNVKIQQMTLNVKIANF